MKSTKEWDIVLLTQGTYLHPEDDDGYAQEIVLEDHLLQMSLEQLNFRVCRKAWDDPEFDWTSTSAVIFRAVWDYFERIEEFKRWFEKVKNQTLLINPSQLIEWNLDKHYLFDLEEKGVRIPPTVHIPKGNSKTLAEHYSQLQNKGVQEKDCVLKPCISGGAWHTYLIKADELKEYEDLYQDLVGRESLLLQEFQRRVPEEGERSYMIFGNQFSHAVLKKAKSGDFRVQSDYGGSVHPCLPSAEERQLAIKVTEACPGEALYARVDMFRDNQGLWALAEVELIEPELWFRMDPNSSSLLAKAIKNYLHEKTT